MIVSALSSSLLISRIRVLFLIAKFITSIRYTVRRFRLRKIKKLKKNDSFLYIGHFFSCFFLFQWLNNNHIIIIINHFIFPLCTKDKIYFFNSYADISLSSFLCIHKFFKYISTSFTGSLFLSFSFFIF